MLGEVRDDRVGDAAAGRAALVDDEHAPHSAACARIASSGSGLSQRRSSTRARDAVLALEALRGAQREAQAVRVADDQEVASARRAVHADLAGQEHARAAAG